MTRTLPRYLIAAMIVCGVAAVVASFLALTTLAAWADWPGMSAILLPLMIDSLAGACLVVWLRSGFPAPARALARRWALVAVVASAAMNALSHTVTASGSVWRIALVVVIGSMPPVALAALIEVAVRITGPLPAKTAQTVHTASSVPGVPVDPQPVPVTAGIGSASPVRGFRPGAPTSTRLHVATPDDELLERVRELDAEHLAEHRRGISQGKLASRLGVHKSRAARLLRLVREVA